LEKRRFFQWVVTTLLVTILEKININNQPLLSQQDITTCNIKIPQGWYHWQPCTFDIDGAMAFFVSVGGNYLVGCHLDKIVINKQPLLSKQDVTTCNIKIPQGWYHWKPCTFDIDGAMAFFVSAGGCFHIGDHFGPVHHQQSTFALTTRRHDMQKRITSRMVPLAAL
jgi:hypothetical protein